MVSFGREGPRYVAKEKGVAYEGMVPALEEGFLTNTADSATDTLSMMSMITEKIDEAIRAAMSPWYDKSSGKGNKFV